MNDKPVTKLKAAACRLASDREGYTRKAGIIFCVFAFLLALIRSAVTAITYDEAFTYLFISRENMLNQEFLLKMFSKEGCIANNHWLNSFLIFFVTRYIKTSYREFTYSEFMIRLPILMTYLIYLLAICSNLRKKNISFPVLILLVGNYYLNEFYGLARGYGMANTFIFLVCMRYLDWKRSGFNEMKYLLYAMIYAILAVLSNTIVLLLFPALGLVCLYRLLTSGNFDKFLKKAGIVFALFAAVCLLMLRYHLNVSSEGKPLFTGGHSGFFDNFVKGYLAMFISGNNLLTLISVLFTALAVLSLIAVNKQVKDLDFSLMAIIFIMTNLIMEMLLHRGYIAHRVLLPFYAFLVLAVCELFCAAWNGISGRSEKQIIKHAGKAAVVFLCACVVIIFCSKIELRGTKDWSWDYKYRTYVDASYMTGIEFDVPWNAAVVFYRDRAEDTIDAYYSYMR